MGMITFNSILFAVIVTFVHSESDLPAKDSDLGEALLRTDMENDNVNIDEVVRLAVKQGLEDSDALDELRKILMEKGKSTTKKSSKHLYHRVTANKEEAKKVLSHGQKSVATTRALAKLTGLTVDELKNSPQIIQSYKRHFECENTAIDCKKKKNSKYRSVDGTCNNINNPSWGAAFTTQQRYLPAEYEDVDHPRTHGKSGKLLPSARFVSNAVFKKRGKDRYTPVDVKRTLVTFAWGQFIDHDLAATPTVSEHSESSGMEGTELDCCAKENANNTDCFNIDIPAKKEKYFKGVKCMSFVRSAAAPPASEDCIPGHREQLNQLTAFIDAGTVYGDSYSSWRLLREKFEKGKKNLGTLLTTKTNNGNLLPPKGTLCSLKRNPNDFCQLAGDFRVNVVPSLSEMHLLFVREHNRIAKKLAALNEGWTGLKIFQETRKIIGAFIQHITFNEYLPELLGSDNMRKYGLTVQSNGSTTTYKYNETINPSIKNVFAAAAYRFGHSLVPPVLAYTRQDYSTTNETDLEDTFLNPHMIVTNNGLNVPELARFIASTSIRKVDSQFEDVIRNKLFQDSEGHSLDLTALNIQRGRDHGLPGYIKWRKWCGLTVPSSFKDMDDVMKKRDRDALQFVYEHVEDIDVYAGGIAERPIGEGAIGPLFACIIGNQFRDVKFGDRYWYENNGRSGFTAGQLEEIRKVTLAKIYCDNMNLTEIQPEIFLTPGEEHWERYPICRTALPVPPLIDAPSCKIDKESFHVQRLSLDSKQIRPLHSRGRLDLAVGNQRTSCSELPYPNLEEWKV